MSIQQLFYPRGVAVVGSVSEGKLGYELLRKIVDGGYEHVYAVNPKAQGALSAPGFQVGGRDRATGGPGRHRRANGDRAGRAGGLRAGRACAPP